MIDGEGVRAEIFPINKLAYYEIKSIIFSHFP